MRRTRPHAQSGSVVLVALCLVAVLGISIGSYLALSTQAMKLSNRTFQTTLSEHLAEMGLEYGIAAMNRLTDSTPPPPFSGWTDGSTTATWLTSGGVATGVITLPAGMFGDSGVRGAINVRIDNYNVGANARPWDFDANYHVNDFVTYGGYWFKCLLDHTGQPPAFSPVTPAYWGTPVLPLMHAEGVVTLPDGTNVIKTQLVTTLTYGALFPNALAAAATVNVASGVSIDSYDSSLGTYNQISLPFSAAAPNIGSSAVLAGGYSAGPAVKLIGAVTVNGYVAVPSARTTPFGPLWKYTPGATILTGVIPAPPPSTPDLLRVSRSPYIPGLAPKLVTGGLTLTFSQGIDNHVGTPGALAPTVYQASASLDFTDPLTRLTVDGPVVINVAGDITLGTPSGAKIIVGPMGSAEIHFSGTFSCVDLTGGGIENQSFNPLKLVFIGTGTGVNTFNCTTDFYGAIYTPNADITWSGGNLYGALSAKNITLNGGWVHYDVALRKLSVGGVDSVYVISKWREITSPTDPDRVPGW